MEDKQKSCQKKWDLKYDRCLVCESNRYPHIEGGLCSRCHHYLHGKEGDQRKAALRKLIPRIVSDEQQSSTMIKKEVRHEEAKPAGTEKTAPTSKRWSYKYDRCVRCESDEFKHVAQGLCSRCYEQESNRRNRGERGAGQSFNKRLTEHFLFGQYVLKKRSSIDIAKDAGCSRQAVTKALKKFGFKVRSQSEASDLAHERGKKILRRIDESGRETFTTLEKIRVDERFFSSWSPEMAWVLGLIYTDGNIDPGKKRDPGRKSHQLPTVRISQKEPELLRKICVLMKTNARLRYREERRYSNTVAGALYTLEFQNDRLYADLLALGVTPRKSLTLSFPEMPSEFVRHFLRGCWDGDGTVHVSSRGKNQCYASIVSGSRDFIDGIVSRLYEIGIWQQPDHTPLQIHPNGRASYDIRIKGKANLTSLFHYLYGASDSSVRLERKYQNFDEIVQLYKST